MVKGSQLGWVLLVLSMDDLVFHQPRLLSHGVLLQARPPILSFFASILRCKFGSPLPPPLLGGLGGLGGPSPLFPPLPPFPPFPLGGFFPLKGRCGLFSIFGGFHVSPNGFFWSSGGSSPLLPLALDVLTAVGFVTFLASAAFALTFLVVGAVEASVSSDSCCVQG